MLLEINLQGPVIRHFEVGVGLLSHAGAVGQHGRGNAITYNMGSVSDHKARVMRFIYLLSTIIIIETDDF